MIGIVGANFWAVRETPARGLDDSLEPIAEEARKPFESEDRMV